MAMFKRTASSFLGLLSGLMLACLPLVAHAGIFDDNTVVSPRNISQNPSFLTVVTNVYNKLFIALGVIAGGLAVLYVVWAGIQYIQSGGDAAKAKAARGAIINAVIGIAIVIAAYAFVRIGVVIGGMIARLV